LREFAILALELRCNLIPLLLTTPFHDLSLCFSILLCKSVVGGAYGLDDTAGVVLEDHFLDFAADDIDEFCDVCRALFFRDILLVCEAPDLLGLGHERAMWFCSLALGLHQSLLLVRFLRCSTISSQ